MEGLLGVVSMISRLAAIVAGIWLMFAPAALGYGDPAAANDRIFGPIGAAFAFVALWEVVRPLRWGTLPVGSWLIVAPLILGYEATGAFLSSIGAGLVMLVTAFLGGETRQEYGGGWSTLLPGRDVPTRPKRPGAS
jgi:hypothetical protein